MKDSFFKVCKLFGLFYFSKLLTKNKIRILGYHGVWFLDDHYGNHLNLSVKKFADRMSWLKTSKYNVISLDKAIDMLNTNLVEKNSVVITIDDGWYSTYSHMLPEIEKNDLPATLYVTTSAVDSQKPLYHVLIRGMLHVTKINSLTINENMDIGDNIILKLTSFEKRDYAADVLCDRMRELSYDDREKICREVAAYLDIDIEKWISSRQFANMSYTEISDAELRGLDIQLHTHNHNTDILKPEEISQEIKVNRAKLSEHVTGKLEHFCYPSGVYSSDMFEYIEENDVKSATLVDVGLVSSTCNKFEYKRILDGQEISQLEFEAELSGFLELLRPIKNLFKSKV